MKRKFRRWHKVLIIISSLLLTIVILLITLSSNTLVITSYTINNDKLANDFSGAKIALISDLHNQKLDYDNGYLLDFIDDMQPDLILLTGDIIDEWTRDLNNITEFIQGISSIPSYYVNGNHDIKANLYNEFIELLDQNGIINLSGTQQTINVNGGVFTLIGIDEFDIERRFGSVIFPSPITEAKLNNMLSEASGMTILLSHHADFYPLAAELGFDMMVAGHYHGGHIRINDWTPLNWVDSYYGGGKFTIEQMELIVSRGTGDGWFPFRINCNPEIVEILLTA
jgi:uncharacterized protein